MKKLRYINLGAIDPNLIDALWEYSRIIIPESPTLFSFVPNEDMVLVTNLYPLDKYLYVENLSKRYKIARLYKPKSESGNVVYDSLTTVIFSFHFPKKTISSTELVRAEMAIKVKVLRRYGIEASDSPWRQNALDLCFKSGEKYKKCGSHIYKEWDNFISTGSFISFEFNLELARKLYKMETDKFKKKGSPVDIGDVVGGLHEINPNIGIEIAPEIAQALADRFDLEFKEDNLTPEETSKIQALADKLNNDNWKLYGKHPEIK